jgi:hypothetical protein
MWRQYRWEAGCADLFLTVIVECHGITADLYPTAHPTQCKTIAAAGQGQNSFTSMNAAPQIHDLKVLEYAARLMQMQGERALCVQTPPQNPL